MNKYYIIEHREDGVIEYLLRVTEEGYASWTSNLDRALIFNEHVWAQETIDSDLGGEGTVREVVRTTTILNSGDSEEDLRKLMRSPAYWRDNDPAVVKRVQDGFKRLYGGTDGQGQE